MTLQELNQRAESLATDIQKVQNGLRMMSEQEKTMTSQLHQLMGHLNEVKYQASLLAPKEAPAVESPAVPTEGHQENGETNCENAEQVA